MKTKEKQFKNLIHSCYKHNLFLDEASIKYRIIAGESKIEDKIKVIEENLGFFTLAEVVCLDNKITKIESKDILIYKKLASLCFSIPIALSSDEDIYNIFYKLLPTNYSIKENDISKSIELINRLLTLVYYSDINQKDKNEIINYIDDKVFERLNALEYYGVCKDLLSKSYIKIQNRNLYNWYKDTNGNNLYVITIFDLDNWNYDILKRDFTRAVTFSFVSEYLDSFLNYASDDKLKKLLFLENGNCNFGIWDEPFEVYISSKSLNSRPVSVSGIYKYFYIFKRVGYIDKIISETRDVFYNLLNQETINYYNISLCFLMIKKFVKDLNALPEGIQEFLFKAYLTYACGGEHQVNSVRSSEFPDIDYSKIDVDSSEFFDFIKDVNSKLDEKKFFYENFSICYSYLFKNKLSDLSADKVYNIVNNIRKSEIGNADEIICIMLEYCKNIDQHILNLAEQKSCFIRSLLKNKRLKAKDKRYLKVLVLANC